MNYLKKFDNYLTKKGQKKSEYNEYLYDIGFGDRYYICSDCDSYKLTPKSRGGISSPSWHCADCGYVNYYSPKWMDPEEYKEYLEDKEIKNKLKNLIYNIF